ncbi:MAG: hypothetical protein A2039_02500 [Candidatus Melainabacteria bacterium GWA2_34_9]|nr:MAG: hypothetical protein A2039_02500 [Candidatus Melainabacteria bacterium GWA2_34_9]
MRRGQIVEVKKQGQREKLLNIINAIGNSLDINEIKNSIVNEVAKAFNADRCFIRIFQTEAENIIIENVSEDFHVKSSYSLPIVNDNEFIGALTVQYTKRKVSLGNGEIETLKAIVSQAAIAIKQAEMVSAIKQKAEREELLRRITQNIRQSLDLNEVLDNICSELFNLFNVDKVALSKYSESEDNTPAWTFLVEYQKKDLPMLSSINPTYNTSSYFAKQIFNEGENIIINNIDNSNYPDYLINIYKNLNVKSLLSIPIKKDNENWGAIGLLEYTSCRKWSQDEINLIETIADQISIAIKQAEMVSAIKQQAEREELLRADKSIVINKNLARNLGLNCAVTYCSLAGKYYYLKDEGKISNDGYFSCSVEELAKINCLSTLEQRQAIEKLNEIDLIIYKKKAKKNDKLYFKIVNDESYIEYFTTDNTVDDASNLPIEKLYSEPIFCDVSELYETYSNYFSIPSVEATKYFLTKSKRINKLNDLKISKLYFSVICRTLHSFMIRNKLNLDAIKLLINNWFEKDNFVVENKVVSLNSSNKVMLSRLKKILFYRFQEARSIMATNFSSKMDFYYCFNFDDLDFLKELSIEAINDE